MGIQGLKRSFEQWNSRTPLANQLHQREGFEVSKSEPHPIPNWQKSHCRSERRNGFLISRRGHFSKTGTCHMLHIWLTNGFLGGLLCSEWIEDFFLFSFLSLLGERRVLSLSVLRKRYIINIHTHSHHGFTVEPSHHQWFEYRIWCNMNKKWHCIEEFWQNA